MSDHFLYEFQKQPTPEFKKSLYVRISSVQSRRISIFPALAYGLVVFMLGLVLLVSVSPPARVYAQEIIYSIGQWIISHQPTAAEQFENKLQSGEIEAYDTSSTQGVEWEAPVWMSAAEAETLAGFEVIELDLDGFDATPVFREVQSGNDERAVISVSTVYQLQEGNLVFRQTKNDPGSDSIELPVGDADIKQVVVACDEGYWIENLRLSTYVNEENKVEPKYANVLVWATDEFEFWMQSVPGLPLEEMLLITQGMY